jgi:hypothetical protein
MYVLLSLPETKGRSLEEIEAFFTGAGRGGGGSTRV